MEELVVRPIAHIRTDFPTKFGIPRQSGLAEGLTGRVVFEKEFRNMDALRGIEEFSHIWLIWAFSKALREGWSATVRPPRLGGNARVGVFASRSPFRPNPIGLSLVRLKCVEQEVDGPVLYVLGADLMDGTPIYDIKPYLPYVECVADAAGSFADAHKADHLAVLDPAGLLLLIQEDKRAPLIEALSLDPRPAYQDDPVRVYGFLFAGFDVRFTVSDGQLTIREVVRV